MVKPLVVGTILALAVQSQSGHAVAIRVERTGTITAGVAIFDLQALATPTPTATPSGLAYQLSGRWFAHWQGHVCFLLGQPFLALQDTTYEVTALDGQLDIQIVNGDVIGSGLAVDPAGTVQTRFRKGSGHVCQLTGVEQEFLFDYTFTFNTDGTGTAVATWSFGANTNCESCQVNDSATLVRVSGPLLSETPTPTPTPSLLPPACGDGHVDPGEDCDDGGTCTGGSMAGTHCTSAADCGGTAQPGTCLGGPEVGVACIADTDCPNSSCVRCKTFGGTGCAANCTFETDIAFDLVPGVVSGSSILPGTSGATVFGEIIPMLPLPLTGSQVLTIGKAKDGKIPLVIKAPSVQFPQIPVSNIACACVRGFEAMTCGGVLFEVGGTAQSPVCNDLAVPYDCTANGKAPCSTVHGTGNSASGEIGCQGLDAVNVDLQQDCNGEAGGMPFPPVVTISGAGGNGSAIVLNSIQIGTQVGACTANFCTDADPPEARGMPQTLPYTTGMATATVHNANDVPGFDIGPQSEMGSPFTCQGDGIGSVAGVSIAGAFTACDQPTIADIVVTNTLVGASQ